MPRPRGERLGLGLPDSDEGLPSKGVHTLVYDGENHATSSSGPVGSGTYTYDGRGLRIKKVSGSTTTVYIFSGSKVIAEYDNGAAPSREYIYAGGALLAKIDASGTRYYQHDHLSNRLITDSSGNILAQLGHSPFGESWYNTTNEKWLFTTYERDAESGSDYAMARSYASRLGRFLSPDPAAGGISDPQSWNRYSYAHNDPINFVDPSGMFVAPQIYALMLFYHVPMFGSLWNEFDLLFDTDEEGDTYFVKGAFAVLINLQGGGPTSSTVDNTALAYCANKLFGVGMTSFTPSVPGDSTTPGTNGSFSGAMAGIYNGTGNPLLPGPYQFTVTNDVSKNWQLITAQVHLTNKQWQGIQASGYTNGDSPFTNFSARNVSAPELSASQIYELGNSLGFITGQQIPAVWVLTPPSQSNEPGNKFWNCYQNQLAQAAIHSLSLLF